MTSNVMYQKLYGDNLIGEGDQYIQIQTLGAPIYPTGYIVNYENLVPDNVGVPISWTLSGSNDGLNFDILDVQYRIETVRGSTPVSSNFNIKNAKKRYSIFRLNITESLQTRSSQGTVGVPEFKVFDFLDAPPGLEQTVYVPPTAQTSNETLHILNDHGNQTDSYISGYPVQPLAKTNIDGTIYGGEYLTFSFPQAFLISKMSIISGYTKLVVAGSNDGETWRKLIDTTVLAYIYTEINIRITKLYSKIRVIFTQVPDNVPYITVKEIKFFDKNGEFRPFILPFCLDTNSLTHSGSLNFSQLNSFSLSGFTGNLYAVNHNLLEISNGMGQVAFT